jgi:hypothetical protein
VAQVSWEQATMAEWPWARSGSCSPQLEGTASALLHATAAVSTDPPRPHLRHVLLLLLSKRHSLRHLLRPWLPRAQCEGLQERAMRGGVCVIWKCGR